MVILRGLDLTTYNNMRKHDFLNLDDDKTQVIDIDPAVIDVELPKNIMLQYNDLTGFVYLIPTSTAQTFSFNRKAVEYIEIK